MNMSDKKDKRPSPSEQFRRYYYARRPILYIQDFDFASVDRLINDADRLINEHDDKNFIIKEYSAGSGVVDFRTKSQKDRDKAKKLVDFLAEYNTSAFSEDTNKYLLVLKDVHERYGASVDDTLADPRVCSLLQSIAQRVKKADENPTHTDSYDVTVVIVDSELAIPPELEKWITMIDIPLPDEAQIDEIIEKFAKTNSVDVQKSYRPQLRMDLKGLTEFEILQLLNLSVAVNGSVSKGSRELLLIEKRQAIKKSGLLEAVEVDEREAVGGLKKLQDYFDEVVPIFKNPALAEKHGVSMPAGVMIVGMPGCGKSLSAKCVAQKLDVPLLRLDIGRLMGRYVGESEGNLARAIRMAESASPCVLWIDEIEKAFAGIGDSGGGGEVTTRMFGAFLTWMQEKKTCVYVVATANDISNLPPEFLRRGRFDEIFQVSFPTKKERDAIFAIHIKKRNGGELPNDIDTEALAEMLPDGENYSGADIESMVRETMKRLFCRNINEHGDDDDSNWESLTQDDLKEVVKSTSSSFHSQQEKLKPMLEKLKKLDVRSAS